MSRARTALLATLALTAAMGASDALAACGDGIPDGGESCDDGNTDPADGCSATCQVEPGFACTAALGLQPGAGVDLGFEADDGAAWDATDTSPGDLIANNIDLSQWAVLSGQVDLLLAGSALGTPPEGQQAIDLTGTPGSGTISQDLITVPGERYKLSFQLAQATSSCSGGGPFGRVFVRAQDPPIDLVTATLSTTTSSTSATWDDVSVLFDATSSATRLALSDVSGHPFCGAVVDDIRVAIVSRCGQLDADDDGLLDAEEDLNEDGILDPGETDPFDADTDDDGLSDAQELRGTGPLAPWGPTDPRNPDTDGDGVGDGTEVGIISGQGADTAPGFFRIDEDPTTTTDPHDDDVDDDGLLDGSEDANGNGLVDAGETDPEDPDTDGDTLSDGLERGLAAPEGDDTQPALFTPDGDAGFTTTDPTLADTDEGGIDDNIEDANRNGVVDPGEGDPNDPLDDDTDGDGLSDAQEDVLGTSPTSADTDQDGLTDRTEAMADGPLAPWGGTDPLVADTDGDGLLDGTEVGVTLADLHPDTDPSTYEPDTDPTTTTNPLDDDTDDDGLMDGSEDLDHDGAVGPDEADPNNHDTDGDTLFDGTERGLEMPEGNDTEPLGFRRDSDPNTTTDPARADTDGGGIPDGVEDANLNGRIDPGEGNPNDPQDDDDDGDGLTNAEEDVLGTSPTDADTDDDGLTDLTERDGSGPLAPFGPTDPTLADTDGDGILDGVEVGVLASAVDPAQSVGFPGDANPATTTDPNDDDVDDDGLLDGSEDANGSGRIDPGETDPRDPDSDGDGLLDGLERGLAAPEGDDTNLATFVRDADAGATTTDPLDPDTDGGGVDDDDEDANGDGAVDPGELDPNDPSDDATFLDGDGDGLSDAEEALLRTDPADADTDDDGLSDLQERDGTGPLEGYGPTDPTLADTDGDGVLDGTEVGVFAPGTGTGSGFVADLDPDTTTDPNDDDTDDDGLLDGTEDADGNGRVDATETDPDDADTDADGLLDGTEVGLDAPEGNDTAPSGFVIDADRTTTTDPLDPDTDDDFLPDGIEDANLDGRVDEGETDPREPDTDLDGLLDGDEDFNANGQVDEGETDPLVPDSDGDGIVDGDELELGTDPLDPDSDGDGFSDGFERDNEGDPLDPALVKGSGCSTGPGPLGFLVVLVPWLLLRGRRSAWLAALLASGAASAQDEAPRLDVQRFDPVPQVGGFTLVRDGQITTKGVFGGQLHISYALNPLELGSASAGGRRAIGLVDHLIAFDVGLVYSPLSWLEVGLQVPVLQVQANAPLTAAWSRELGASGRNVGLGDLALSIAFAPLNQREGAPLSLSITPRIVFPTGSRGMFLGSGAFEVGGEVSIARRWKHFRFSVTGGYAFQSQSAAVGQVFADDEARYGLGLGVPFADDQWEVVIEAVGGVVVSKAARASAGSDAFGTRNAPAEALLWARYAPKTSPVWFRLGGGRGLTGGFGSPDLRLFAAIGLHTDRREAPPPPPPEPAPEVDPTDTDGDGFRNDLDSCPAEPEDFNGKRDDDGCPDADSDGDRVPDAFDACPDEPEDPDLFQDNDGCPELDNDLDGIPDDRDDCPKDPETLNGLRDDDGCPDGSLAWIAPDYREILISERIFFSGGSATIERASKPILDDIVRLLRVYPSVTKVEVQGFASSDGEGSVDLMEISERRAEEVRSYLLGKGIAPDRVSTAGLGDSRHALPEAFYQDEHAQNRRVEFRIVEYLPPADEAAD